MIILEKLDGKISTYSVYAYSGQVDMHKDYVVDGKVVGRLEYSIYDDEPYIQMTTVLPEYKRKGIATELLKSLDKDFPNTPIHIGYTTDEGTPFYDRITYTIDNPEYARKKSALDIIDDMLAKIDVYWEDLYKKFDDITDEEREQLLADADKVQTRQDKLESKKRELEDELDSMPQTLTYLKF